MQVITCSHDGGTQRAPPLAGHTGAVVLTTPRPHKGAPKKRVQAVPSLPSIAACPGYDNMAEVSDFSARLTKVSKAAPTTRLGQLGCCVGAVWRNSHP